MFVTTLRTMIPFNKPYFTGNETKYITESVESGKISGDGKYTKLCHDYFENKFGFKKCLLTTSCTDALEMTAILIGVQPGDEVIMPSYTFVSTANAFALRGAKIIFADSRSDHPGMDESSLSRLITSKTKAIVPVHYAGVACDMDAIMDIALKHGVYVVEDAAQAVDSYYTSRNGDVKPLGSIGHFGTFSFHETKNIMSGEGGMLVINDDKFIERAEIIREKGTDRSKFFRGEVDKYGWVELGSSFLPSDIIAAFLFSQLENLELIQNKRIELWKTYQRELKDVNEIELPVVHINATNNAHMFYLVCKSEEERNNLIDHLKKNKIQAVFHYQSLHKSPYFSSLYEGEPLNKADNYSATLLRLPLYFELSEEMVVNITDKIKQFYLRN